MASEGSRIRQEKKAKRIIWSHLESDFSLVSWGAQMNGFHFRIRPSLRQGADFFYSLIYWLPASDGFYLQGTEAPIQPRVIL